jgi:hypothetical protein
VNWEEDGMWYVERREEEIIHGTDRLKYPTLEKVRCGKIARANAIILRLAAVDA